MTVDIVGERKGPEIKTAILMWPTTDTDFSTESFKAFGADRFLTTPFMEYLYDLYIPDHSKRKDIHVSPLLATTEELKSRLPEKTVHKKSLRFL